MIKSFFVFLILILPLSAWADDCAGIAVNPFQEELMERFSTYDLHTGSRVRINPGGSILAYNNLPDAVVSFGSGPDVLTPILLAPKATSIHLVDITTAWGLGSGEVLFEVKRRLAHIDPNVQIDIVHKGFTKYIDPAKLEIPPGVQEWGPDSQNRDGLKAHFQFPKEFWKRWGWPDASKYNPRYVAPLVFRVRWQSKHGGAQDKLVYFHPLDFNNAQHLESLNKYLPKELGYIVITGSALPSALPTYVQRLKPWGRLIVELFNKNLPNAVTQYGTVSEVPLESYNSPREGAKVLVLERE